MINPTQYYRPKTINEALQRANLPASIAFTGGGLLLGGVTLPYESVIDLQDLPELKRIRYEADSLSLGASLSLQTLFEADELSPALKRSLQRSLSPNLRNSVSLGESLMQPQPLVEWVAALAALSAEVLHYGFEKGQLKAELQCLPLLDFLLRVAATNEPYAGIIDSLVLPVHTGRACLGQAQVARTPADLPIVNAALYLQFDDSASITTVKTVIGGASASVIQVCDLSMMLGQVLNEVTIAQAAQAILGQVKPVADYRGSVAYRREMAALMTRRALEDCRLQLER